MPLLPPSSSFGAMQWLASGHRRAPGSCGTHRIGGLYIKPHLSSLVKNSCEKIQAGGLNFLNCSSFEFPQWSSVAGISSMVFADLCNSPKASPMIGNMGISSLTNTGMKCSACPFWPFELFSKGILYMGCSSWQLLDFCTV